MPPVTVTDLANTFVVMGSSEFLGGASWLWGGLGLRLNFFLFRRANLIRDHFNLFRRNDSITHIIDLLRQPLFFL